MQGRRGWWLDGGDVLCCLSLSQSVQCVSQFVYHTQSAYRDTEYSRLHTNIFIQFSLSHTNPVELRLISPFTPFELNESLSTFLVLQVGCHELLGVAAAGHAREHIPQHRVAHRSVGVHLDQHALRKPGALRCSKFEVCQSIIISPFLKNSILRRGRE